MFEVEIPFNLKPRLLVFGLQEDKYFEISLFGIQPLILSLGG